MSIKLTNIRAALIIGTMSGALSLALPVSALAGTDMGNGGDMCEFRIKEIREDIRSWIIQGGPAGLQLSPDLTVSQYSSRMIDKIEATQISCTSDPVMVGNAEKT